MVAPPARDVASMVARSSSAADRRQRRQARAGGDRRWSAAAVPGVAADHRPCATTCWRPSATHQVVIVAGETGSGKSTQLPKLCLELGRGVDGIIGHTQPRRVAARTIAERVAEELGSALGDDVGYTVRFNDRIGDGTLIRVMTDGILLAELQRDRLLRRYDTLIIDEAHERSLNIDFILGYLRQLLPQRPDLKVIVTSATIDTERFARHFADGDGRPAPVVEVTGRTYPVEVRYRPFGADRPDGQPDDERDQVQAVCDAVLELAAEPVPGDVLVFLSGEREIHDTADALRRVGGAGTEILPLYARLSAAEQHRIFQPHRGRRIVLSTNVAETSITVPGVRFVVDTGVARISRYSRRLKVQRLPIEPISQASANQRAGRCGRIAPGICIRLFGEDDFASRDEFTEPEILRTNLASVILQMTALDLGDVASFPFVEPPDTAAVRDGYLLLEELGAITGGGGRSPADRHRPAPGPPARRPADRADGGAGRRGGLRPGGAGDRRRAVDPGPAGAAARAPPGGRRGPPPLRRRRQRPAVVGRACGTTCASSSASCRRTSSASCAGPSTSTTCGCGSGRTCSASSARSPATSGCTLGTHDAHPDRVHRAVLSGLLSHLGMRDADGRQYRGARGASFVIAPGSVLARKSARWVMAAELVETDRLRARRVATISPEWAERAGAHLVRRSYGEPRWDARRGAAVTSETVTLYGLPIVSGRVRPLRPSRPRRRPAVVHPPRAGGGRLGHPPRVPRSQPGLRRTGAGDGGAGPARRPARRRRRRGLLRPDRRPGRDLGSAVRSLVARCSHHPHVLDLTEDLIADTLRLADYPDTWRQGDLVLPLSYRFDPGRPARRGHRPRPADGVEPGDRRRLRLADPRLPARARRCPRAHAAEGRAAVADPGRRDDRRRRRPPRTTAGSAGRRAGGRAERRRRCRRPRRGVPSRAAPRPPAGELRRQRRRRRPCSTPIRTWRPSAPDWPASPGPPSPRPARSRSGGASSRGTSAPCHGR